jgi:hypothetical protein
MTWCSFLSVIAPEPSQQSSSVFRGHETLHQTRPPSLEGDVSHPLPDESSFPNLPSPDIPSGGDAGRPLHFFSGPVLLASDKTRKI